EKLHVDPSTLWSWDKRGYLRKIEVGGKRLYRESDVEAILNRK
ncbi:MerR family transcriptional regulator, partial [Alistipes onderdonkii]